MLKVLNRSLVPSNLWEFTEEKSGAYFRVNTYAELIKQIESHRRANPSLELDLAEGWEERLDDEICRQNSIEVSHCGHPGKPQLNKSLEVGAPQVRAFLSLLQKTLIRTVTRKGLPLVSPEEAERRAQICVNCPQNSDITGCTGCSGILRRIADLIPEGRKSSVDDRLQFCGNRVEDDGLHAGCGCSNRLSIHFEKDFLEEISPPDADYAPGCWKA